MICTWSWAGSIVPFAGYLLPVQYPAGVIHEHMAVRDRAWGCSTFRTWARCALRAPARSTALNHLMANDMHRHGGRAGALFARCCNENGGIVDDLVVVPL